jgi:hypothetical protein
MIRVDIARDLMDEDETGHIWAFLRDARDQALVRPGAIVVAGDEDAPAVAEVALCCCTKIKNGQLHDRNWPLSWVGDTGPRSG